MVVSTGQQGQMNINKNMQHSETDLEAPIYSPKQRCYATFSNTNMSCPLMHALLFQRSEGIQAVLSDPGLAHRDMWAFSVGSLTPFHQQFSLQCITASTCEKKERLNSKKQKNLWIISLFALFGTIEQLSRCLKGLCGAVDIDCPWRRISRSWWGDKGTEHTIVKAPVLRWNKRHSELYRAVLVNLTENMDGQ